MIDDTAPINTENRCDIVSSNGSHRDNSRETRAAKTIMPSEMRSISRGDWITVAVLCFVNLINYMDRFTIAGKCFIL